MTSRFNFEEGSELEDGREKGVHETPKQSSKGGRRARTAQSEETRREERGNVRHWRAVSPSQKDSCIWNEGSVSLATRLHVI